MGWVGTGEILLIFLVIFLVFGPESIPEVGKILGRTVGQIRKFSNFSLEEILKDENVAENADMDGVTETPPAVTDITDPDFDESSYRTPDQSGPIDKPEKIDSKEPNRSA